MTRCGHGPTWEMQLDLQDLGQPGEKYERPHYPHFTSHVGNQQGIYGINGQKENLQGSSSGTGKN